MKDYTYKIDNQSQREKKRFVRDLFDAIVPTYDLLNHVLSFSMAILWRKNIFKHIQDVKGKTVIDLARTISPFISQADILKRLLEHGFASATLIPQCFGVAAIIIAKKEEA